MTSDTPTLSMDGSVRFLQTIQKLSRLPFDYENDYNGQERALEVIPLEDFYRAAEAKQSRSPQWAVEDYVVQELVKWFKNDFFKWTNAPKCTRCDVETSSVGLAQPSSEDQKYGAQTVEVYKCPKCFQIIRFPRYNSVYKLMETRSGRCGEWANVFTFMCYVIGVPVRYVWNSEDHVWTEVYSHAQERWVHVDACEGAFDKPLIYSDGWGKKMAYVIGFSTQGVMDVTKRYVRSSDKALPRSRVDESALESFLISLTAGIRGSYSLEFRLECQDRDELELVELVSYADGTPSTPANEIGPRESGKGEWTKVRGEDGTASS